MKEFAILSNSHIIKDITIYPSDNSEAIIQRLLNAFIVMKHRELIAEACEQPTTKEEFIEWCKELSRWKTDFWNKIVKKRENLDRGSIFGKLDGMLDHIL